MNHNEKKYSEIGLPSFVQRYLSKQAAKRNRHTLSRE